MRGLRIATIAGIPIEVNASWIVIFALIFWSLYSFVFPTAVPFLAPWSYLAMALVGTVAFFSSLLLHELSHSLVSMHFGLRVRRIILFLFGGISEATTEMPSARVEFLVAIAGPLMSFALAGIFWLVSLGLAQQAIVTWVPVFQWLAIINAALGLFNLLPGFPLDGGRVLRSIVWQITGSYRRASRIASTGGRLVASLLIAWGLFRFVIGDLFGAIWIGFLGYLLFQAATSSFGEVVIKDALSHVGVESLMSRDVQTVRPDMTVQEAVETTLSHHGFSGYPVEEGHHLEGLLLTDDVRRVQPEEWPRIRVTQLMRPIDEAQALSPEATAADALDRFNQLGVGRLPVVQNGELVGILSQTDIVRWIAWHPPENP